jgi:hypothetical protein
MSLFDDIFPDLATSLLQTLGISALSPNAATMQSSASSNYDPASGTDTTGSGQVIINVDSSPVFDYLETEGSPTFVPGAQAYALIGVTVLTAANVQIDESWSFTQGCTTYEIVKVAAIKSGLVTALYRLYLAT